jgi:O-acetyl-ADP-ribose deacetylase (regulator of RNase III)
MGNKPTSEQKPKTDIGKAFEEKTQEIKVSMDKTAKEIQTSFEDAAKDMQVKAKAFQNVVEEKSKAFQNVVEEKSKAFQNVMEEKTQEVQTKLGLIKKTVVEPLPPAVEERDPRLCRLISTVGTNADYTRNIAGLRLLPAGSAFYTSSGKLQNRGILGIIHAATGSSSRDGKGLSPTLASVANSVRNAMILAQRHEHTKIAIPFIGGAIFLSRIMTTLEELAGVIIKAAIEHKGSLKVALVPYGDQDTQLFQKVLDKLLADEQYANARDGSIEICAGDITMKNIHGADVIVNAANTEAKFGGGLSGAIGHATSQQQQIDREASKIVASFIDEFINQHN